jgi:hypothetical protein
MSKTVSRARGGLLAIAAMIAAMIAACSGSTAPGSGPVVSNTAAPGSAGVLLYGTADLEDESRLRLQPIACVIGGKLATARACGESMPAKARVKIVGGPVITVERSSRDYKNSNEEAGEGGEQVYRAPLGPQCCSYHACVGETIPYFAPAGAPSPAAGGVLAIWPDDAELGLVPYEAKRGAADREGPPGFVVDQLVRAGSVALAAGRAQGSERCLSCAQLQWFDGSSWRGVAREGGPGADGFHVMATTDLDRDGRAEAIVREIWRNDYGLLFLGNDWSRPLMRYSCGNI